MCGIFGGFGVTKHQAKDAINLIKRGEDGITIDQIDKNIVFAARRHLVKKSGFENKLENFSDQPYYSKNKNIVLIFNGEFYNFEDYKKKKVK
tara:strand:+ start:2014 stop:2289 length:276 start_codon:yes stop_codon:yes gene_type:complete